ncbi:MAG: arylsulfatase [bacterium]|nr:arylsulfatase [bacterium]
MNIDTKGTPLSTTCRSIHRPSRRAFLAQGLAALGLTSCAGAVAATAARGEGERPNIVLIMADDMGFSDIGCYGGEIETPNLDGLAASGIRFTQAYSNAKCAPTRASLLTGLYAQQVGCHGGPVVMENCVTIAEVLKSAGYRTFMTGKWHAQELPVERGFDRYYGLCDGCCNFFNPGEQRDGEPKPAEKSWPRKWAIDSEVHQPYTPEDPGFYTTDAFTDYAVRYLDEDGRDDTPFFLYVAYTAPHYPMQAPPEDIAKYRGRYSVGWDEIRRRRFERMVDMGLIRREWGLSPRDPRVAAWEDVEKREAWDLAKMGGPKGKGLTWESAKDRDEWDLKMSVYAAMVDRMDQNIGRILTKIHELGKDRNTLIIFLADNGGCAEFYHLTQDVPPGTVDSYRTVDPPWANAQNTPFRKYKQYDHEGGISSPFIVRWPARVKESRITHEMAHIIDIMATCGDVAGAEYPETYDGRKVLPLEGKSLLPIIDGEPGEVHYALYWQFGKSRAVRRGKWKLVGEKGSKWELYDMEKDRTELRDLSDEFPERVEAMTRDWDAWADRVGVKGWS